MTRYRTHSEIVIKMLSYVSTGQKRYTDVMCECRLSYVQMQSYVQDLVGKDLIFKDTEGFLHITVKGMDALKALQTAASIGV